MKPSFFQALATLGLPEGMAEELLKLRPADVPHRETLVRRLSLLRTFDERAYRAACDGLAGAPSLAEFSAVPDVEPLLGRSGRYTIREQARSEAWRSWVADADERRKWARELSKALGSRDEIEALDRLQIRFLWDEPGASRELEEAFERADRADDFPRCAALVQLVSRAVMLFGGADTQALLRRLQARQQSRNLFFTEFYQTTNYFPRPEIELRINRFEEDRQSGPWIFHMFADGGMGKTTLLRRMVSHEWVTSPRRLPCAWIDFDYLDVPTVLMAPWLLALPMAAQWNEQLDEPIFGSLLEPSYQPMASLLFRARSDGSAAALSDKAVEAVSRTQYPAGRSNPMRCGMLAGAAAPQSMETRKALLDSARHLRNLWDEKFAWAVASMPAERPVILVLDTLEEASLQHSQELRAVLQLIAGLRQRVRAVAAQLGKQAPELRLILSGRYQLGVEHLPEFKTDFAEQYIECELKGLGEEEAGKFLRERLAADQLALVPAMVSRALGIPFHLCLFSEWAKEDPKLKEATILEQEEISAVMLIERIVKRIAHQPLRWVIRYGAVPRMLSFEFLRDVMRVPLEEALAGKAASEGLDNPVSALERDVWTVEPGVVLDCEALWREHVLPYASGRGWMQPSGEGGRQVAFRPDVLRPMRLLLKRQLVFKALHRRAAEWYATRAENPELWRTSAVEHVYHRVQLRLASAEGLGGDGLVAAIKSVLDAPRSVQYPALRCWLAQEFRTAGFEDLTGAEKAYVEYRWAEAIAAQENYSYKNAEATRHLLKAFEFLPPGQEQILPAFAEFWHKAVSGAPLSLLLKTLGSVVEGAAAPTGDEPVLPGLLGRLRQAVSGGPVSVLLKALAGTTSDDVVQLALLIADMSGPRSPVAAEALEMALKLSSTLGSGLVPDCVLLEKLGNALRFSSRQRAADQLLLAAKGWGSLGNAGKEAELLCEGSAGLLGLGKLTEAETVISTVPAAQASSRPGVLLQRTRIELAKGQPGQALSQLESFASLQANDGEQLESLLLRAEALSQRGLWQAAMEVLQSARELAQRSSKSEALLRVALAHIRLERWWLRQTQPGRTQLNENTRREDLASGSDELDVWSLSSGENPEQAARRLFGELGGATPEGRVRLILALSRVSAQFPASRWQDLLGELEKVPRSARFLLLVEPVLLGTPPEVPREFRKPLAKAFERVPHGEVESAWYAVRYGELLGWLGMHRESASVLERYVPKLNPSLKIPAWHAAVYRERRRVEQRLRSWGADFVRPEPDPIEFWLSFWAQTPYRRAAVIIENAQRAFDASDYELVKRSLEEAMPVLQGVPFPNAFAEAGLRLTEKLTELERARGGGAAGRRESDVLVDYAPAAGMDHYLGAEPPAASAPEIDRDREERLSSGPASKYLARIRPSRPRAEAEPSSDEAALPFQILAMRPQAGRLCALATEGKETLISADSEALETLLRARGIPRRLSSLPLESLVRDLAEVLEQTGAAFRQQHLWLRTPLGPLSAAPWELAFAGSPQGAWRAPSGWQDPGARELEDSWRAKEPAYAALNPKVSERPRNFLAMPLSPQDKESPAIQAYLQLGSRIPYLDSPESLAKAARVCQCLHIATSFVELPSLSEPAIAGWELGASRLAYILGGGNSPDKPTVVLDVPSVRSYPDLIHQLLMRNYFAQTLLDSGAVNCVLGTGLYGPEQMTEIHALLLEGPDALHTSQAEFFDRLRALEARMVLAAHSALFTRQLGMTAVPGGPPAHA